MRKLILTLVLLLTLTAAVSAQTAPAKPKFITRTYASWGVGAMPTFKWAPATGANSYQFELRNTQGVTIIDVNVPKSSCVNGECKYKITMALNTLGEYIWRVGAKNSVGTTYTNFRTFGIHQKVAIEVLRLVNVERCNRGLAPLALNPRLSAAALRHSTDMATNNFFSHTGSDGSNFSKRAADAGYSGAHSENAAAGYTTASAVVAGWMGSSGHRFNILNSGSREMGLAKAYSASSTYGTYWTQVFGARSSTVLGVCP